MSLLSLVVLDYLVGVDGKLLVGIDDNAKEARVCLPIGKEIKDLNVVVIKPLASLSSFTTTGRLLNHLLTFELHVEEAFPSLKENCAFKAKCQVSVVTRATLMCIRVGMTLSLIDTLECLTDAFDGGKDSACTGR